MFLTANINFLAVLVVAVISMAIGSLWYSPVMFMKPWQRLMGFNADSMKDGMPPAIAIGLSFITTIVVSYLIALVVANMHLPGIESEVLRGGLVGLILGLMVMVIGMNQIFYERRSFALWLISNAYPVVWMTVGGIVLGAWK